MHVALTTVRQSRHSEPVGTWLSQDWLQFRKDTDTVKMAKPTHKVAQMSGTGYLRDAWALPGSCMAAAILKLKLHKKPKVYDENFFMCISIVHAWKWVISTAWRAPRRTMMCLFSSFHFWKTWFDLNMKLHEMLYAHEKINYLHGLASIWHPIFYPAFIHGIGKKILAYIPLTACFRLLIRRRSPYLRLHDVTSPISKAK